MEGAIPDGAAMVVPHFFVRQKITFMVNRYQILDARPDGTEGSLLAFAEQKRWELGCYPDAVIKQAGKRVP